MVPKPEPLPNSIKRNVSVSERRTIGRTWYQPTSEVVLSHDGEAWVMAVEVLTWGEALDMSVCVESRRKHAPGESVLSQWFPSRHTEDERLLVDPMRERMLHRKFCDATETEEGVIQFAAEYGLLRRWMFCKESSGSPEANMKGMQVGEFVWDWLVVGRRLRALAGLAKARDNGTKETVSALLAELQSTYSEERKREVHRLPTVLMILDALKGDQIEPAAAADRVLTHCLNVELSDGVAAVVQPRRGAPIKLAPKDLLGAIYLHFLNELIGAVRTPAKCEGCGKWFVPEDARKVYCSNACKVRAYRAREREKKNGK